MPKKRVLSPKSIWDYNQVQQTFVEAGIKESHLQRLYTYVAGISNLFLEPLLALKRIV
jgi:hypothetical protein